MKDARDAVKVMNFHVKVAHSAMKVGDFHMKVERNAMKVGDFHMKVERNAAKNSLAQQKSDGRQLKLQMLSMIGRSAFVQQKSGLWKTRFSFLNKAF
jgi:hypothetical protein